MTDRQPALSGQPRMCPGCTLDCEKAGRSSAIAGCRAACQGTLISETAGQPSHRRDLGIDVNLRD